MSTLPTSRARRLILHHHENYDGSGYPKGLAGEAIPLGSRLIALTDSLEALERFKESPDAFDLVHQDIECCGVEDGGFQGHGCRQFRLDDLDTDLL